MTTSEVPLCCRWRKSWADRFALCERAEAIARRYPQFPLEVIIAGRLWWYVSGETLQAFAARVKRVADVLGPADKVADTSCFGTQPDLVARWCVDGVTVEVFSSSPAECAIDPSHPGRCEIESAQVHPRCRAVLAELEDYEPAGVT